VEQSSVTLSQPEVATDGLGFFRWGRIAGKVLLTNDAGDWAYLSEDEFSELLTGGVADGHPRFQEFQDKGFLRDGLDLDALATKVSLRNRHVRRGPHVHVVTLTLRHSGAGGNGRAVDPLDADMSADTAEKIVAMALEGTSPVMTFELQGQGGEPLLNFDVLRHLVEFAQSHNKQTTGKALRFVVLSNFTGMNEEAAEWLIANDVLVSTVLDGPPKVHDENRKHLGGSSHADVVRWIDYFHRRYAELGRDPKQWQVGARVIVTKQTLKAGRKVVDEYAERGMRAIHFEPLDRSRVDADTWTKLGYSTAEYLDFYRGTLDYILDLNRKGTELTEGLASIIATKILTSEDPGIVDIQSPYGAGTGQIAYNVDGRVFPCDEARVVDAGGDAIFEIGRVENLNLLGVVRHPTVRAIAASSLLDAQPMCADCWNKPYCGYSPVRNFVSQGDLCGQRPLCFECKEHMAVSTRLFELLADESDSKSAEILEGWTTSRSPHATDARARKSTL
jgi:His-Xaa-Ser system radical SAM maturase HxsB